MSKRRAQKEERHATVGKQDRSSRTFGGKFWQDPKDVKQEQRDGMSPDVDLQPNMNVKRLTDPNGLPARCATERLIPDSI